MGIFISEVNEIRSLLLETVQIATRNAIAIQANSGAIADLKVAQLQQKQELQDIA